MAAPSLSSTEPIELKTGALPKSQYNSYNVRTPSFTQHWSEKCLLNGKDRRKIKLIKTDHKYGAKNVFNLIGQLKMKVNNAYFVGTAFVITYDSESNFLYALTAAHNVCDADPITKQKILCSECWFNRRDTHSSWWHGEYSELNKSYRVERLWVHPKYDPLQHTASSYDIAIVAFSINKYSIDRYYTHDIRLMKRYSTNAIHGSIVDCDDIDYCGAYLYGYPGEKKGQMWGMKSKKMEQDRDKGLLLYDDVDTSGGQSGSPIFIHQARASMMELDHIPLICIGVHTGGSVTKGKNWGVYLDKNKRDWIEEIVQKNSVEIYYMLLFESDDKKNRTPYFMLQNGIK